MNLSADRRPVNFDFRSFVPVQRLREPIAVHPRGDVVAYIGNASGAPNIWLQPVRGGSARQLTRFDDHAVRQMAWAPDGRRLAFTADHHGDEQYRVHLLDTEGDGTPTPVTDGEAQHVLARVPFSPDGARLLYAVNDRDPAVQDLVVHDLRSGERRRFVPPDGVAFEPVAISPDGRRLLAAGFISHTDIRCYLADLDKPDAELTPVQREAGIHEPGPWAPDGGGFHVLTDAFAEFTGLGFHDLSTRTTRVVAAPGWDVETVAAAGDSTVVWTVNEAGRSVLHARRDRDELTVPELPDGVVTDVDLSDDGSLCAVLIDSATRPAEIGILDLTRTTFTYLTDNRPPGLRATRPVAPELVAYPGGEDRSISAFLYRPEGTGPFPVLLSIHGGPEAQERPNYARSGLYQYLLSQGIGIMAPNVVGSTGYGTAFQKRLYRDWGGCDLDDYAHTVDYLAALDWVDADRLAVMGGSYGGFAALSCLTRLPDRWAAGVSICGPSNLETLARASPPTWKTFVATTLGDPDADGELLEQRSPIRYIDRLTAPLCVVQGAQDPRVPQSESDRVVDRLRDRGVDVSYLVFDDEGHGFTKRDNEISAYTQICAFLTRHLCA